MKKVLILLIMIITINHVYAQKQVFEDPNLKEIISKHKTIAILPFKVSLTYKKLPKNFSEEGKKSDEESMSYSFQQGLMTFLLKTSKDYFVSFQDVERTNILLKKANVYDNLDEILADSLCKILNVDAVIKSHYTYEKTKSEGAAMVNTVLWGSSGRTGTGSIVLQINNGLDGKMIWRYYNIMFEQSNFNANNMMERMMKKISRNFPYTK